MKVIKLQAWEKEFQNRIVEVREKELAIFRKWVDLLFYSAWLDFVQICQYLVFHVIR